MSLECSTSTVSPVAACLKPVAATKKHVFRDSLETTTGSPITDELSCMCVMWVSSLPHLSETSTDSKISCKLHKIINPNCHSEDNKSRATLAALGKREAPVQPTKGPVVQQEWWAMPKVKPCIWRRHEAARQNNSLQEVGWLVSIC